MQAKPICLRLFHDWDLRAVSHAAVVSNGSLDETSHQTWWKVTIMAIPAAKVKTTSSTDAMVQRNRQRGASAIGLAWKEPNSHQAKRWATIVKTTSAPAATATAAGSIVIWGIVRIKNRSQPRTR